jgi:hypothetical protein
VLSWWDPDDVKPWVMTSNDEDPIAYGELWLDADEDEVEIARLVVAPICAGTAREEVG